METLIILGVIGALTSKLCKEEKQHQAMLDQWHTETKPGLSSQRAQIKPVAASKQPYLGPKRTRDAEFYRNRRTKKAVRKLPF